MKDTIRQLIQQALDQLTADGTLPAGLTPDIQVENTRTVATAISPATSP